MADDTRRALGKALSTINADYAEMVVDKMSDVETYPAPFLKRYKIYKVLNYGTHPVLFYVGFAPGAPAYLLTGSLENYVQMAKDDGVTIHSPEAAAEYVATALEVTRSMSELVYVVKSVDDVEFAGDLDADEERQKQEFLDKYRARIQAPQGEPAGTGYHVTAFVVANQNLSRYSMMVSTAGGLTPEVTTLEENLPLMMGA